MIEKDELEYKERFITFMGGYVWIIKREIYRYNAINGFDKYEYKRIQHAWKLAHNSCDCTCEYSDDEFSSSDY